MPLPAAFSFRFRDHRVFGRLIFAFLLLISIGIGALSGLLIVYRSDLPRVQELQDYRPNVITELYSDDGRTIGSFALERRVVITYEEIPRLLRDALIATEDKNFERHWGVDIGGIARAVVKAGIRGGRIRGTSTITQQLSRLCFLTAEKSFKRKFQEFLFSIQIERFYTKAQILTLYCNQVPLGHRTYGFEAAAQFYFSKRLRNLTLDQIAVLAALPAIAHLGSPMRMEDRVMVRRNYVLRRMVAEGKITRERADAARQEPLGLRVASRENDLAPYFAEEVRKYLAETYGSQTVRERGLRAYTTLNLEMQAAAVGALTDGLEAYDRRHGWRGVEANVLTQGKSSLESFQYKDWTKPPLPGQRRVGLVVGVTGRTAQVKIGRYRGTLYRSGARWTRRRSLGKILRVGDLALFRIISVDPGGRVVKVELSQRPRVQGAIVAIDNASGEIKAMVGGHDFGRSKFNRSTQAYRQPGSAFKPFVYTLALEEGMTPEDLIEDTPISFPDSGQPWSPRNYDGKFEGLITLRRAFAHSRNIPAVRLADRFGIEKVLRTARRFGITGSGLAPFLPVALGAGEVTLLEMTSAFSAYGNDGVRVSPRYLRKVTDYEGATQEEQLVEASEVVSRETAGAMVTLLQSVVEEGTARRARGLNRAVAGKTGTTNDYTDAWFIGLTPSFTCGVWVGFDQKRSLGRGETGGRVALPIWIEFVRQVTRRKALEAFPAPILPGDAGGA